MKPYGNQLNFKKKVSYESKKNSEKTFIITEINKTNGTIVNHPLIPLMIESLMGKKLN